MLKLERNPSTKHIAIRLKEKKAFVDRPFFIALVYSVLFHLIVFGFFKVQMGDPHEAVSELDPIEVAMLSDKAEDQEIPDLVGQVQIETQGDQNDLRISLSPNIEIEPKFPHLSHEAPPLANLIAASTFSYDDDEPLKEYTKDLAWTPKKEGSPLNWRSRIYPLCLKFSDNLQPLVLLEDGSRLFKEKSPRMKNSLFSTSGLTSLEYNVKIHAQSGKIEKYSCKKDLQNMNLEQYGNLIIRSLRFAPTSSSIDTIHSGRIWVTFLCPPNELRSYLREDVK